MRESKKIVAFLLSMATVVSLGYTSTIKARAAENEPVKLQSGTYKVSELDSTADYNIEDAEVTFVIDEDKTLLASEESCIIVRNGKLTITGDKTLILGTSKNNNPIIGGTNSEITIESGNVEVYDDGATSVYQGTVFNMNGGTFTVHSLKYGVSAKTINISGGVVNSPLACGSWGSPTVNITGGTVRAVGKDYGIGQEYRSGTLYSEMTLNISGGDVYAEATEPNYSYSFNGHDHAYLYSGISVSSLNFTGGRLEAKVNNEDQVAIMAVNGIDLNNNQVTEPSGGSVESCSIVYGSNTAYTFPGYTIGTDSGYAGHVIIEGAAPVEEKAVITTPPTANSLVNTGEEQALVTDGIAEGGTMVYALGEDSATAPASGWSTAIPAGKEAKTYYVWYMAKGDDSHLDSDAACVPVVIAEKLEANVTFKVVNGSWNSGETADKTVTLRGKEGDTLKLSSDQIPAAGSKPNEGYKEGAWDVAPSTETAITADTTYIYSYVADEIAPSVQMDPAELELKSGDTKKLATTVVPEGTKVTYSSSNEDVVSVDDEGNVTAKAAGTSIIKAEITVKGTDYSASCKVTVVASGTPMPIPVPSGSNGGGEHTHKYVWETIEATEDADGELRYQCETCGDIQTRVPMTAYNVFNKNTTEKIRNAKKDATVKIETNKWISFHKMVMEALAERPDVTLEISFLDEGHKGKRCTVVIPKGTDTMSLVDKNGFTGFLFLGGKFGMKTQ